MRNYVSLSGCICLMMLLLASFSVPLWGQENQAVAGDISGREIAARVYDRYLGDTSLARVTMRLINKRGAVRERQLTINTRTANDLRSTLIRFQSPADIEGTGFLSLEGKGGKTTQFLYLPALKRSRRIVSSQKARSFVNTDFTYEDLERRQVDKYDHRLVGDEMVGGRRCWVLESRPRDGVKSQYVLMKLWVDQESAAPLRINYYGKRDKLIKTYEVKTIEKRQDIWTEIRVEMVDLEKQHRTVMVTEKITYNTPLDNDTFTTRFMEAW